jgi:hypothetical protein
MKLSGRVPEASESFRAQPAILHYKAYLPAANERSYDSQADRVAGFHLPRRNPYATIARISTTAGCLL